MRDGRVGRWAVGCLLLGLVIPGSMIAEGAARAQTRPTGEIGRDGARPRTGVVVVGPASAPSAAVDTWRTHVERAARLRGYRLSSSPTDFAVDPSALGSDRSPTGWHPIDRHSVAALTEVEERLASARVLAGALRETEALRQLAVAQRVAEDQAGVPGAAAWLAEVETWIGVVAEQGGLPAVATTAFSRAATLDPSRGLRAAEAPPEVVERAEAIARAVATRPRSTFEVHANVPGATVTVDEQELGAVPQTVRVPTGRHLVRVSAPGYRSFGRVVDALEGARPAMRVTLSPNAVLRAGQRLEAHAGRLDAELLASSRRSLGLDSLWVVRVGSSSSGRALLVICEDAGCSAPRRLELDEVPIVVGAVRSAGSLDSAADERWLAASSAPPTRPRPASWWERWYVWTAVGAAVVLAATAVVVGVVLAEPTQVEERRFVIDPCEVLGSCE